MSQATAEIRQGVRAEPLLVRFSSLQPCHFKREMHVHTTRTDGMASIAELVRRAEQSGLELLVITEHVRADSHWFGAFADEVRKAGAGASVEVLVGAEARIKDFQGGLDISAEIRKAADFIIASVHRFPDVDGTRQPFSAIGKDSFCQIELDLALAFLRHGDADVLGHPGGMSFRHLGHFPVSSLRALMREARAADKGIEINSSYLPDLRAFLALLAEEDPLVSIGSDVHRLEELGECSRQLAGLL